MRIAITGSTGRLGRALARAFADRDVVSWSRPAYDLDDAEAADRAVEADRPDVIVHSAAWTDVDGCAREPARAQRRNATAVGELGRAAARCGARLVVVSTNEVFDGNANGRAYRPGDVTAPINPYGQSKLAGELAAVDAFGARPEGLLIVRTAWLYGPPGNDFPVKVIAAARRAQAGGQPLRLVADETGSPTNTRDLAEGIATLVREGASGVVHVVNSGQATRAAWALAVLTTAGIECETELVPMSTWARASQPPAWGVLASDLPLRPWAEASEEYVRGLVPVSA